MTSQDLFALSAMLLAAVVQGCTGFGFGLVAVSLLALALPVRDAAVLNAVPALAINLVLLWHLHRHLQWQDLRAIAVTTACATPLGVVGLQYLDPQLMNGVLAVVLASAIFCPLLRQERTQPWHALWLGIPVGILSGLLAGAYGTGGPPAVAFIQSYRYEPHRHVASVQILLAIAGTVRVCSLLGQDALTTRQWLLSGAGALAALPGVWLGLWILQHLPPHWLHRAVFGMLTVVMIRCALAAGWLCC